MTATVSDLTPRLSPSELQFVKAQEQQLLARMFGVESTQPRPSATPATRCWSPEVGDQLAWYELERRLGAGGMGEVFAARHVSTHERVALKTLSKTHATLHYRFKREFRSLADITHPNLVQLGELVVLPDQPAFFTMELLEGQRFVRWVRGETPPGQPPEIDRLQQALRQLLSGLEHLHANQFVHRDLKPSNVLVGEQGRVVILDFGLVSEIEGTKGVTQDGQILGTPAYMAPEQAMGAQVGPAADFYAFGIMLFECLTGQLPFVGSNARILADKRRDVTPDPDKVLAKAIPRLRELCLRLLTRDPERRPDASEIAFGLEHSTPMIPRSTLIGESCSGAPRLRSEGAGDFFGRRDELEFLDVALDQVRANHELVTVHLSGRCGYGKSKLIEHFVASARRKLDLAVLRGRCRERESVPYKGLDAVIDALCVYLRRLPDDERLMLRPRHLAAVVRIFPVLDDLWVPERSDPVGFGPDESRSLGWAGLREIISKLGATRTLVVVIDDFQWADTDSVDLLRALTRPPDAPTLLLLVSFRTDVDDSGLLANSSAADELAGSDLRALKLGPLPRLDARKFALALLQGRSGDADDPSVVAARAEAIVLRSRGNPFYITQLVLADAGDDDANLEQLVADRLARIEPAARIVLEVVAVSGRPLSTSSLLQICRDAGDEHVEALVGSGLLVRDGEAGTSMVETAHDRIRDRALAGIEAVRIAEYHRALGELLLAQHGPIPSGDEIFAVVNHLDAALVSVESLGLERRLDLARLNERAGVRSLEAGAWTSARRYYEVAFQLAEPWLAEARLGRGPRDLCLAIASGRVQAEAMCRSKVADLAFEDLLTWSLSLTEYGQIVARQVAVLNFLTRVSDAVDLGVAGLARLGLELPSRPTLARAFVSVLLAWRSLANLDLDTLRSLPDARDERARATMGILFETAGPALLARRTLFLILTARGVRLALRHGYQGGFNLALSRLALCLNIFGRPRAAARLAARAQQLTSHRPIPPRELIDTRTFTELFAWHSRRFSTLVENVDSHHHAACGMGLRDIGGQVAGIGGALCIEAGMPLPALVRMLDEFQRRDRDFGSDEMKRLVMIVRAYTMALMQGSEPTPASALVEAAAPIVRHICAVLELSAAILASDYSRASERVAHLPADYSRVLMGNWYIPRVSLFIVIVIAERWPRASLRIRWQLRRQLRRHRKITARWAGYCGENYGPMADIVLGEIAALEGRDTAASMAFERARAGAAATGVHDLVGLACARLARLMHRRGQALLANAAFEAGLVAYEAWGASSLACGLRERGLG